MAHNNNHVGGHQQQTQAVCKPPAGKHGNNLPLWGNEKTMNLNPMILTNVLSSPYFKVQLYELKTYHEVVDEIYFKVTHVEPWEKGSRKTAGQTGMCGGVRGVGTGGIVSTAFCLLYKLFTLKLTRKQVMGLITHSDSPYIRALGFMYIRYTQPPPDLVDWYDGFLDDEEELDVKAGGGCVMTIGEMLRSYLTKLEWFSTLFPRIPVPVQKMIDTHMKARPRKVPVKEETGEEEAGPEEGVGRPAEYRSPRRTPSPRRSPHKRSRSGSHHRDHDRRGQSFDNELERERDRQRKDKEGRGERERGGGTERERGGGAERERGGAERERGGAERGGGGAERGGGGGDRGSRDRGGGADRERRRSRSADRPLERRERGSRERRGERKDREKGREGGGGGGGGGGGEHRKDREHHKDRAGGEEGGRSKDKRSKGEGGEQKRSKEARGEEKGGRHREERKEREKKHKAERSSKRRSRSGSRGKEVVAAGGGEEKEKWGRKERGERDGEQRAHKRSRSKERGGGHRGREPSNGRDHGKHGDRRRSLSMERGERMSP